MISGRSIIHWIFIFIIPIFIILFFFLFPLSNLSYPSWYTYTAATIIVTVYYIYFALYRYKGEWTDPFTFTFLFQMCFSIMGVLVYEFRGRYWTNDPADMEIVGQSVFLAPILMLAGKSLVDLVFPKYAKSKKRSFNPTYLVFIIWGMIIIGNIASLFLYNFYADIPLFSSNIDASRSDIRSFSSGRGTLFILQLLLVLAIPLSYIHLMKKKPVHWHDILLFGLQFLLSFIPLLFYGGRFYFLTPILLTIVCHSVFISKISLRQAVYFGLTMLIIAMAFVTFRIFGSDVNANLIERAVWADIFPEIRAFGYVAYKIPPPDIYPQILTNFLASLFPSGLLRILNIDKELLLFSIGDYVASIIGASVPIRLGLLGEAYLAYGIIGIIIVFFCLGVWLELISKGEKRLKAGDCRHFFYIVLGVISALIIPYGTNMISTLVFCIFFAVCIVFIGSKFFKNVS